MSARRLWGAARHRSAPLVALAVCWLGLDAAAQNRPNLVLVVTDDQRADALGCAGHPFVATPNLDALAQRGVRFTNAFVTTPICAASRASIVSGVYEGTHHCTFGTPPLAPEFVAASWPRLLRAAGYRTGFVGKWGVRTTPEATRAMWDRFTPMSPPYLPKAGAADPRHLTERTVDRAIEFLREGAKQQPFCLMLSFNAPHAEDDNPEQYVPPPELLHRYDDVAIAAPPLGDEAFFAALPEFQRRSLNRVRWHWRFDAPEKRAGMVRRYFAMVTGVDAAFGRLCDALRELGVADDTVVVFTSDNGCFLGERGFAGKWTIHEPSIRVPLIVADPRTGGRRGAVVDRMALNVDLAPTLLELAGLAAPSTCQGRSLVPLCAGDAADWRDDFFVEHRTDNPQIPKNEGVRGARWVYTRYYEQDPVHEELYDLANDPLEAVDLAGDPAHAADLQRMRRRCAELRAQCWR